MKRTAKDFRNYVSAIRRIMPTYNNDRKVVVVSEETKRGQQLIKLGSQWDGKTLNQIYDSYSEKKKQAYDDAYEMYRNSRHSNSFGICSHNSYGFTVSWLSDDGLTILTPTTEYLVVFNE